LLTSDLDEVTPSYWLIEGDSVGQGYKHPNFEPVVGRTNAVAAFLPDVFNNVAQFMQDKNPLMRIKGFEALPAPQGTYTGVVKIRFLVNFKLALFHPAASIKPASS
jgi:hypothetical protein